MKRKLIGIILLIMLLLIVVGVIATHVFATATQDATTMQNNPITSESNTSPAYVAPDTNTVTTNGNGLIAAALSTGLAALGAGIAVAVVGSAALGAISENPKLLGRTIIFVGLAEGIAIYGLIISIMILSKI